MGYDIVERRRIKRLELNVRSHEICRFNFHLFHLLNNKQNEYHICRYEQIYSIFILRCRMFAMYLEKIISATQPISSVTLWRTNDV